MKETLLVLWIAACIIAAREVTANVACERTPDPWECRANH